jgi:hypothetical protein
MKRIDDRIVLCRKGSCCPVIDKLENGTYTIQDDFGGHIILTEDQFLNLLPDAISTFRDDGSTN